MEGEVEAERLHGSEGGEGVWRRPDESDWPHQGDRDKRIIATCPLAFICEELISKRTVTLSFAVPLDSV